MAHTGEWMTLTHAREVAVACNQNEKDEALRDCEYGHINCATDLCPCCFDEALIVIEHDGTPEDLAEFGLEARPRSYTCLTCEVSTPPMTEDEAKVQRAEGHELREKG